MDVTKAPRNTIQATNDDATATVNITDSPAEAGFDGQPIPKKNMEETMNKLKSLKEEYKKKYTQNNYKNSDGMPKK
jgi:hypothetical protein